MVRDPSSAVTSLVDDFVGRFPHEAAAELEGLPVAQIVEFLGEAPDAAAVSLLQALRPEVAAQVVLRLDPQRRSRWLSAVPPVRSVIVLSRLDQPQRAEILDGLDPGVAREVAEILSFPPDSAGAIMDPRVSQFRPDATVQSALAELRELRHMRISSIHVVDGDGRYLGSVRVQDLAVADPAQRLRELITAAPASVQAMAPRAEVIELLEHHRLVTLPVVDFEGHLVGVIRQDGIMAAVEAEATTDMQAMVGASREERALSTVRFAVSKRLPWLQINLLTAFLASFVVGLFEDTIARFTALAVLLPVVAGQSGNTGAQALAVTMRGLALREVRVRQHATRVAIKELLVAALNGVAVALVTAGAVYLWSRSTGLAAVIGVAMVMSMTIAGLAGAMIPMLLTVLGQDPAQASSIVLTTVTDVVGFLSFLGLATLFVTLL